MPAPAPAPMPVPAPPPAKKPAASKVPAKKGAAKKAPAKKKPAAKKAARKKKGKKKKEPVLPERLTAFQKELMRLMTEKVSLLEGLTDPYLYKMATESEYRGVDAQQTICREGDYGTTFWIVLGGMVKVLKRGADGQNQYIASIGRGSFFGEMGPMSAQPRAATCVAETECRLLEVPEETFFYFREASDQFREVIDTVYKERALITHLSIAPIFKGLGTTDLRKVADIAQLVTLDKDEVVVKENEPSVAFYLVRHGFLKVTKIKNNNEEIIAYLRDNTYFGEQSLLGGGKAVASVIAMSDVECVKIDQEAFLHLVSILPALKERQEMLAEHQITRLKEMKSVPDSGKMEVLIRKGLVQTRDALVIDTRKCTRCETCVHSCSAVHGGHALIQLTGMRVGDILFPASCYQCKTPECMLACRFGCITRDRSGQVYINEDTCTGCTLCSRGCPYGTLFMVDREEDEGEEKKGLFARIFASLARKKDPVEMEIAPQAQSKKKAKRLAVKCDQCMGHGFVACVYNCPTGAIKRVKSENLYELL
jgi:CRP-like cAMP-binding protein